jgi:hypothetical protein
MRLPMHDACDAPQNEKPRNAGLFRGGAVMFSW